MTFNKTLTNNITKFHFSLHAFLVAQKRLLNLTAWVLKMEFRNKSFSFILEVPHTLPQADTQCSVAVISKPLRAGDTHWLLRVSLPCWSVYNLGTWRYRKVLHTRCLWRDGSYKSALWFDCVSLCWQRLFMEWVSFILSNSTSRHCLCSLLLISGVCLF